MVIFLGLFGLFTDISSWIKDRGLIGVAAALVGTLSVVIIVGLVASRPHKYRALSLAAAFLVTALSIGTIVVVDSTRQSNSRSQLEVSSVSVLDPAELNASVIKSESATEKPEPFPIKATPVDITLKNDGPSPQLIDKATVEVVYAEKLEDCAGVGGPVIVSGEYAVKLPDPMPIRPFTQQRDLRFEVKAGSYDRLALTVGPLKDRLSSPTPWLIVARIGLHIDRQPQDLDVGAVAMLSRSEAGMSNVAGSFKGNLECVERNSHRLAQVYEIQATRATELDRMRIAYASQLDPDPAPATETCTSAAPSNRMTRVCGTYRRWSVMFKVDFSTPPVAGDWQLAVDIHPDDQNPIGKTADYRLRAAFRVKNGQPQWLISSLSETKGPDKPMESWEGGGSFTRANFDPETNELTITADLDMSFGYKDIQMSTTLKDIKTNLTVLESIPVATSTVTLVRGN